MAAHEKRGRCPKCCPDGGAIFERTYDFEGNYPEGSEEDKYGAEVWKCLNCGYTTRVQKQARKGSKGITRSQERQIRRLWEIYAYPEDRCTKEVKHYPEIGTVQLYIKRPLLSKMFHIGPRGKVEEIA